MRPVIGISQMGNDLFRKFMKSKYVQSIRRAGGEVRWIEVKDPERAVAEALECDGLVLAGGVDVDPQLYGQEPTELCGKPDKARDMAERMILDAFLPTNKPIFCVCRGMQFLNVYFGGTLHQDIKRIQLCKHQQVGALKKNCHKVRLLPRSKLQSIFGEEWIGVNSYHHQAIDQLGPGLNAAAVSEDGFIEGVEVLLHPFCVGVQWHPEHMSKSERAQQALIDAFVKACTK